MNSNLLIAAVDERKLFAILRYNAFTPDDGAWCDFVRIENLECAPTVGSLIDENNLTFQRIHAISKVFVKILIMNLLQMKIHSKYYPRSKSATVIK